MFCFLLFMQALGWLTLCCMCVLYLEIAKRFGKLDTPDNRTAGMDLFWRTITFLTVIPALASLIICCYIPETPRFLVEIKKKERKAVKAVSKYYQIPESFFLQGGIATALLATDKEDPHCLGLSSATNPMQCFWVEGRWRYLAALSILWTIHDSAFYALFLINPRTLGILWYLTRGYSSNCDLMTAKLSTNDLLRCHPDNLDLSVTEVATGLLIRWPMLILAAVSCGFILVIDFVMLDHIRRTKILAWLFALMIAILFISFGCILRGFGPFILVGLAVVAFYGGKAGMIPHYEGAS